MTKKVNWLKLCGGLALLAFGVIIPSLITVSDVGILVDIRQSLATDTVGLLVLAAIKLVFLNTLRAIPIYIGVFLITGELFSRYLTARYYYGGIILPFFLTLAVYRLVDYIYSIYYDFSIPAVTVVMGIIFINIIKKETKRTWDWVLIVIFLLFGLQWLDIAPMLSGLGFGGGEVSRDIKLYADFFEADYLFNIMGFAFSSILVFTSLLLTRVTVSHYREMERIDETRQQELQIEKMRQEAIKLKTDQELLALVHDLKTPLTTIVGLSSLLEMQARDAETREICRRLQEVAEGTGEMISQIRSSKSVHKMTLEELINYTLSQAVAEEGAWEVGVSYHTSGDGLIRGNKILLSRALLNLVKNSWAASSEHQVVQIQVERTGGNYIISVLDEGVGMSPEELAEVFEVGFSRHSGQGLGLPFVRQVVEDHGGEILIESVLGRGTKVSLTIPGGEEHEKENNSGH